MKERFHLFIGWIVSLFIPDYISYRYSGNKIKCNVDFFTLRSITEDWKDEKVKSVTVIYHDKFTSTFTTDNWRVFGHSILKNCSNITVKVDFK